MSVQSPKNGCRIVLTGGPGAGKTTAADLLRREIGEELVVVPEAATMLFAGGFPRDHSVYATKATQRAIYHVQRNLESVQLANYPHRTLLCDRGTVDSSIYWPDGPESFFKELDTSLEDELNRYDGVVFFETAAVGKISIEGGNRYRVEDLAMAVDLDQRLRKIWKNHPRFDFVPHEASFIQKMNNALKCIQSMIAEHKASKD